MRWQFSFCRISHNQSFIEKIQVCVNFRSASAGVISNSFKTIDEARAIVTVKTLPAG
jgi:hypothetical protein